MKKMKKIICTLLATVTAFTVFASCKDNEGLSSSSPSSGNEGVSLEYTNYDLVKGGDTEYKIVTEDALLYNERLAKEELIEFFSEATGVTLDVVTESQVEYSDGAKLIILGETQFTDKTGVAFDSIPEQGFTLKTVGSNLFVLGEDYGLLYGVYEFLHQAFGFEFYAADAIALTRGVKDMKMPKFNFSDAPDILWRHPNYGAISYDVKTTKRFRMVAPWITGQANFVHNTFGEYFPKGTYSKSNPEYYSEGTQTQLCYTAHGDAEALEEMQTIVVERIKTLINTKYENGEFLGSISFTHEDNNDWCSCESCAKMIEAYGTAAATVVSFINPVAVRVREWMEEAWPGHEVNIAVFAYLRTEQAPVQAINGKYLPARKLTEEEMAVMETIEISETEKEYKLNDEPVYKPKENEEAYYVVDESMYLEDNVALFFAPLLANFHFDFNNPKNAGTMETIRKWSAISEKMYFWLYSTHFGDYLIWYDSFDSMQPLYQMVKEYNGVYLFDQGRYNASVLTAFDMLKCYLNAKLAWDVDADYGKLINDFFENYFQEAAVPMRKYFEGFRSWSEYLKENTNIPGQVQTSIADKKYWPKQVLTQWEGYIEEAYNAIKPLKNTDRTTYDKLYERIEKEGIAIRYHLYELHADTYDPDELTELRKQCKADLIRLGFTKISEGGALVDITNSWGV